MAVPWPSKPETGVRISYLAPRKENMYRFTLFQKGQKVRCTNPTHPFHNPFIINSVSTLGDPTLYYPVELEDVPLVIKNHDHTWAGCKEDELVLCPEEETNGSSIPSNS